MGGGGEPHDEEPRPGSPKPGTGRPQYSSSRKRFTFVRATSRHHARRRGQRSQRTTSRLDAGQAVGHGAEDQPSVPVFCGASSAFAAFASAAAAPFAARLALSASMRSMICARGASGAAVISWPSTFLWIASW